MNKKIKIAWICHFTNDHVQLKLPLWKKSAPFAAWIPNTLEGFQDNNEFDLHIISPHQYLKRNTTFKEKNITYHFFTFGIPVINRSWPTFFDVDLLTKYFINSYKIQNIIRRISPDLINLQGAENPYYGSSVLGLCNKYPILVTIQGFVSLEVDNKMTSHVRERIQVEQKILKKCDYFGGDADSKLIISSIKNSKFAFFNYFYPHSRNVVNFESKNVTKEYDILFWGRVTKGKGAEDFIEILSILKQDFPSVKAQIIGAVSTEYLEFLKKHASSKNCLDRIKFTGFIFNNDDLYKEVVKSKVLVIPTYNDRLPTVLREAMQLGLPIASYKTGSIPFINNDDEIIFLSEQGDLNLMASQIKKLLVESHFYEQVVAKAKKFGEQEFGVKSNCLKMSNAYKEILAIKN